jgi:hypothetical protein
MITSEKVAEIERLLTEGHHSQRTIAVMANVSRGTVAAIAAGRRPNYDELRRRRAEEDAFARGPVGRCSTCGGTVRLPCRLCHVRKLLAESKLPALPPWPEEAPQVTLTGEYRLRYEEVHGRRLQAERQESAG